MSLVFKLINVFLERQQHKTNTHCQSNLCFIKQCSSKQSTAYMYNSSLKNVILGTIKHLTNRFHVAVRLFSNRSQMTSKCGKNKKVAHEAIAECVTDVTFFI